MAYEAQRVAAIKRIANRSSTFTLWCASMEDCVLVQPMEPARVCGMNCVDGQQSSAELGETVQTNGATSDDTI